MPALLVLLLIRTVVPALLATWCVACSLVPDDAADPARGAGVAVSLHVASGAVDIAVGVAAMPSPACRQPLPDTGPMAVTSVLTWTRKAPGLPDETTSETVRWARDADGDVSAATELTLHLPDGRATRRSLEDRLVGDGAYAAVDGRFAEADRLPGIRERAIDLAFGHTDALLTLVALDARGELVPADGDGLCGAVDRSGAGAGLPAPSAAALEVGSRRRSGWLRWDDDDGTALVVTFDERIGSFGGDVTTPDQVWDVDPVRAWSATMAFLREGRSAGWLGPARLTDGSGDPDLP